MPRTYPCEAIVYDSSELDDPYWQNPLITANFDSTTAYLNLRNGAIAELVGDVTWTNFKTCDNLETGFEVSMLIDEIKDDLCMLDGALIVGRTDLDAAELDDASPHGIVTPRTENFSIKNVKFYNYDWNNAAALGSCSHCEHPQNTDSGARTIKFSDLEFDDDTVTKRI